jgi:hypothetical protein
MKMSTTRADARPARDRVGGGWHRAAALDGSRAGGRPRSTAIQAVRLGLRVLALFGVCLIGPQAAAAQEVHSRLYEMTTETVMPHLEENLRYAVLKEKRCMSRRDLSSAFWMLKDVSLQDCRLEKAIDQDDAATYVLVCDGEHGTTGHAQWQLEADQIKGTLTVKLGGKNMTFYQRVIAKPVGECPAP